VTALAWLALIAALVLAPVAVALRRDRRRPRYPLDVLADPGSALPYEGLRTGPGSGPVTHLTPRHDSHLQVTPCCGKPLGSLPPGDRFSHQADAVTCKNRNEGES
jgi:hypothetical protein